MAEKITLATPEVIPQVTTTDYQITAIHLHVRPVARIVVNFQGTNNEARQWIVDDPARALMLIKALNTANLSLKSLERRIFEQAITDGIFTGTITGTPD